MQSTHLQIQGRAARVHLGGPADGGAGTILLLHGAWGGAELHWGAIWERLAERHRVVAPELPGFGHGTDAGPSTIPDLSAWTVALLDALEVPQGWIVGNGFGGAVAWQLAVKAKGRAQGLVLLNGGPPPDQPWLLRKFFALGMARGFVRHALKNGHFGPLAIARGFADPARAPAGLAALLAQPDPAPLRVATDAILRGGVTPAAPRIPALLIWGEADRLPGTDPGAMDRLLRVDVQPRYETLADAGHLPQVEQPAAVAEFILGFLAGAGAAATPARP
jgi:2-hydroxy-6-oxonona-2,4-dienedioate hydrolase